MQGRVGCVTPIFLLLCGLANDRFYAFALTGKVFKIGIKSEAVLGYSIRCFCFYITKFKYHLCYYLFYITKFKYHLCYYLYLFAILAKGTVR